MAKLEIPVRVYMGEFEEIINELKHLQTYKLFEGDDKVLINCDDVVEIFADHLRAEIRSGSTIEPERKKEKWIPVSESLPEYGEGVIVDLRNEQIGRDRIGVSYCYVQKEGFFSDVPFEYKVVAWMPLPEPWRGEEG